MGTNFFTNEKENTLLEKIEGVFKYKKVHFYHGIILARKSDIKKELSSPQASGRYESIPFLENSFYCDDAFFIDGDPRHKIGIRIELYSYEDIYQLASDRNSVFFKLLRREFDLECDQI